MFQGYITSSPSKLVRKEFISKAPFGLAIKPVIGGKRAEEAAAACEKFWGHNT